MRILEETELNLLKHRFFISKVHLKHQQTQNGNRESKGFDPRSLSLNSLSMKSVESYIVLLSDKAVICNNTKEFAADEEFLNQKKFPELNFNQIYFYDHNEKGDISKSRFQIQIGQITRLSFESNHKTIVLETDSDIINLEFNYCWEALIWYEGFINLSEYDSTIARSRSKRIKYNIK